MNRQAKAQQGDIRFVELMRAGHVAYSRGKRQQAHNIWRRAAMLRPYEEQVWLALLSVLDSEEDRRVCLENIIAINPHNLQAQYQLRDLCRSPARPKQTVPIPIVRRLGWRYYALRLLEATLLGVLLAVVLSVLIYR